jgi:hypothetical protein
MKAGILLAIQSSRHYLFSLDNHNFSYIELQKMAGAGNDNLPAHASFTNSAVRCFNWIAPRTEPYDEPFGRRYY